MSTSPVRCHWCGNDPLYVRYHDEEWGVPSYDDRRLFEKLCLEAQQAGLSWITVLRKREAYRQAFFNFNAQKVAAMTDADVEAPLGNAGLIRHRAKLMAIRANAVATLRIQQEHGSLSDFLWGFVDNRIIVNQIQHHREAPTSTPTSIALSKALKQYGFKFLGPTSVYAFMQSVGMVDDHEVGCFRHSSKV